MRGFVLMLVAIVLSCVLMPFGLIYAFCFYVGKMQPIAYIKKLGDYCFAIAVSIDQLGNTVMSELFNAVLIKNSIQERTGILESIHVSAHKFGNPDETISSVIGKNKKNGTLTISGKALDYILNIFEKDHSIKSIEKDEH